jgi:hypothetical protein
VILDVQGGLLAKLVSRTFGAVAHANHPRGTNFCIAKIQIIGAFDIGAMENTHNAV